MLLDNLETFDALIIDYQNEIECDRSHGQNPPIVLAERYDYQF